MGTPTARALSPKRSFCMRARVVSSRPVVKRASWCCFDFSSDTATKELRAIASQSATIAILEDQEEPAKAKMTIADSKLKTILILYNHELHGTTLLNFELFEMLHSRIHFPCSKVWSQPHAITLEKTEHQGTGASQPVTRPHQKSHKHNVGTT